MDTKQKPNCGCSSGEYIVMACSGASDLGYITDQVARELSRNKVRKMNCLAMVGAEIEDKIEEFKKCNVLVIDGCEVDCGKKILDKYSNNNTQMRLTDLRYEKGKTNPNQEVIKEIYDKAEIIY